MIHRRGAEDLEKKIEKLCALCVSAVDKNILSIRVR
jgi:hypothetical protein